MVFHKAILFVCLVLGTASSSRAGSLEAGRGTHEFELEDGEGQVSRNLLSTLINNRSQGKYKWGKQYHDFIKDGEQKDICFRRGTTTCVEYSFLSNGPLLAFVTSKDAATLAQNGVKEVAHVPQSVCTGMNCTDITAKVSHRHPHCLVIMNRENSFPEFRDPGNKGVWITFKVDGCPRSLKKIYIVLCFVISFSTFLCCGGACMYFKRGRFSGWETNAHGRAIAPSHIQMGNIQNEGAVNGAPPSAPPPPHKIHFLQATV